MGGVVRGGVVQYKAKLQLRFSRLSILHISPILKRLNLKKFLSDFQKLWLNLKMNTFPINPSSVFFQIRHQIFFRRGGTQKMGENFEKCEKFRSHKKFSEIEKNASLNFFLIG